MHGSNILIQAICQYFVRLVLQSVSVIQFVPANAKRFSWLAAFALFTIPAASAYQIPTSGAGTWTAVTGGAEKTTPSGVKVKITTTGIVAVSAVIS
jgi:hypothetical protein